MKLNQETRKITRSQVGRETGFTIAANAHAFDILSSKMYSDTKLAIVRELSTNARDAQVEAGNADMPFDVNLPNSMSPYFSIRDYGTGLSPENLETIYTTYFQSTRNDSNDYTGALGLGSKSPFAYTDMFTVTSYYNGTAYTYSAFKNEVGEPSIALLNEQVTTEMNGLEIRIEVKHGDEYDFVEAAKKVYRFFDPKPNISGARIDIPNPTPDFEGDGYMLFESSRSQVGVPSQINVVMGNVCYGVGDRRFTHDLGYNGILVIFAEIGECSVAASREELHYDEGGVTVDNIQRRINEAIADAKKQIEATLDGSSSLLEKVVERKKFSNILSIAHTSITIETSEKDKYALRRLELQKDKMYMGRDRWESYLRPGSHSNYHFIHNDLVSDLKQSDKNRLRHYLKEQRAVDSSLMFYLVDIEDAARFSEVFGDPAVKLSDLPDAPKAPRNYVGSTGSRTFIKKLEDYAARQSESWTSVDGSPDLTDAIAVRRKGYNVLWGNGEIPCNIALGFAREMGYSVVYGIADRHFDRITQELGLKNLEDMVKPYAENKLNNMTEMERSVFHHGQYVSNIKKILDEIKDSSQECKNLYEQLNADNTSDTIKSMFVYSNLTVPAAVDHIEAFNQRYPLISNIDFYYADKNDIIEYINLKENN